MRPTIPIGLGLGGVCPEPSESRDMKKRQGVKEWDREWRRNRSGPVKTIFTTKQKKEKKTRRVILEPEQWAHIRSIVEE